MRWSSWANAMSGEQLVTFVRDEVFPFFADIGDAFGMSFMAQARLAIDEPTVLTQVVTLVNELRLEQADPDTKGDLFEHVLRQIKQAGELGQFRTPRHIIRAIVDLVDPKIGETVYDPAAGTAGFLVAAYEHIRLANSSPTGRDVAELEGKTFERGFGDRLKEAQWRKLQTETFYGNDVDPEDGQPRHDEPGAARPARRAHPQAQRADHQLRPPGQGGEGTCRSTATTWCWPIRRFPAGWTATASSMT